MEIWVGETILVSTLPWSRAESISGRRVQRGIHELLYGIGHVFGGEGCAIGEGDSAAQLKCDLASVL